MRTGVISRIHVPGWTRIFTVTKGAKFCLYLRFNIAASFRTTTAFFTTPACHTDEVKLEQRCIYHSASAPWDLVRGHGAEENLEAARFLSANVQPSESSLQRLLEGRPELDRLVIQHKPRLTCRQQDIIRMYSCFTAGIHDNLPIIQAAVQILRITSCQYLMTNLK